jgi:polysaccharide biosynthesis PFTS motif protein
MFSLSRAQVFENATPEIISGYLQQNRFKDLGSYSDVLIEVRSMRTIFLKSNELTFDSSIYLLFYVLKRRDYLSLFREMMSTAIKNTDKKLTIQNSKRKFFDRIIWNEFIQNNQKRFTMITTQSSLDILPESFSTTSRPEVKRVMMWYSTNSKPINRVGEPMINPVSIVKMKEVDVEHWVWNNHEVEFLMKLGLKSVTRVGSIVFQEEKLMKKSDYSFIVTFFDVTPMKFAADFYSPQITINNLNCVLSVTQRLQNEFGEYLKIRVKPKREYSKLHSQNYTKRILEAVEAGAVELLDHATNLYSAISESDIVLSVPFTSPSVIAKEHDIPTFYCSFDSSAWEIPDTSSGIFVLKIKEDLYTELRGLITKKLQA